MEYSLETIHASNTQSSMCCNSAIRQAADFPVSHAHPFRTKSQSLSTASFLKNLIFPPNLKTADIRITQEVDFPAKCRLKGNISAFIVDFVCKYPWLCTELGDHGCFRGNLVNLTFIDSMLRIGRAQ